MNIIHHIASVWLALLPLALLTTASLAQEPLDPAFRPEGIEATGDTAEIRALAAWAEEHQQIHPNQAEQVAHHTLRLARTLNDRRGRAECLTILGNLAWDIDRAEAHYLAARELFEELGDERRLIHNRRQLGSVYERRGNIEQALAAYLDALKSFERLGDTEGQVIAWTSIGNVYLDQENLKKARTYFEKAVALAEVQGEPILLISILNSFSIALAEQHEYDEAESSLRKALSIAREHGALRPTAFISNNLGGVLNRSGNHQRALSFLFASENSAKELEDKDMLAAVYDEIGKSYAGLGQYDEALRYANESLTLAYETESVFRQRDAHQTLSRLYEAAGNHEQALAHYRQYTATKDSVLHAERTEIIAEMQTRYETEEQKRINERLEQQTRIQALQLILLLGGVGGLLLILGVLFYRYRVKRKANRLLEELDAAKSRFFANISHEFRTPLTVILGELRDGLAGRFGALSEKLTRQHQAMLRNTQQLQQLVDEVLDLNRLEAGKLELRSTPGDLVRSLRQLVEADAPLAERNGIELTFESTVEHCPRLYDEEKLQKIAGNLLSNALKFTPEGGSVRVTVRCGDTVELSVADDGPGIPIEVQSTIFERFKQLEENGLKGGTGIGLALAKELAELHGGTITLESEPGKGSTFMVRLPLEETALDKVQRNTPRPFGTPPSRGEFGSQTAPLRGLPAAKRGGGVSVTATPSENGSEVESDRTTVLIIEDNADVRAFVRRSLEETYRVLEAADGETGLQQVRSELPDLIVSDVMLPGIDGYEIARRLKTEPSTECIPVVMLTARAAEEDQTKGYGSGAEVYITKPFSAETLHAAIARLLEERLRLRRRLREETEEIGKTGPHPTLRDRARAAVLENLYDEDFGVEELASALNMTRFTLYHRFKSEVGASPSTFVQALRMEHARELLAGGAGSVSEVAYAVGFNSLVAFSRAYSAHYGTPPSSHLIRSGDTPE